MAFNCEECKADIKDYRHRVQILDENGFTHSYCAECGTEIQRKIDNRNASISEFGKRF